MNGLFANIKNTIILFDCPSKILHKHCFPFLLGPLQVPGENKNNGYAKVWKDKQRVLWYFLYWLVLNAGILGNPRVKVCRATYEKGFSTDVLRTVNH